MDIFIEKVERQKRLIDALKAQVERLQITVEVRDATIRMACRRLEGEVEGAPPTPANFLRRIDELRAIEAEIERLRQK